MKVFNHDFRASDSEMHAIIEKANLTARGFRKEVTTKLVQNAAGGGAPDYQACHSVCISNVTNPGLGFTRQELVQLNLTHPRNLW